MTNSAYPSPTLANPPLQHHLRTPGLPDAARPPVNAEGADSTGYIASKRQSGAAAPQPSPLSSLSTRMCAHDGLAMGHGPATYFTQHQQQLYTAPAPMPTSGRRVTGTPKERAQSGKRSATWRPTGSGETGKAPRPPEGGGQPSGA